MNKKISLALRLKVSKRKDKFSSESGKLKFGSNRDISWSRRYS